jgi:hypothetical protein
VVRIVAVFAFVVNSEHTNTNTPDDREGLKKKKTHKEINLSSQSDAPVLLRPASSKNTSESNTSFYHLPMPHTHTHTHQQQNKKTNSATQTWTHQFFFLFA